MRILAATVGIALALCGCRPSTKTIDGQIQQMLQKQLDHKVEPENQHPVVSSVDVIREYGNKYQGMADVVMDGKHHTVSMKIWTDGNEYMYEADPTDLLFLDQDSSTDAADQTDRIPGQGEQVPVNPPSAIQTKPGGVVGEFDSAPN